MTLWGGRFNTNPADSLFALSRSVHFDWRLAPYDLVSSKAHLQGLLESGLISEGDAGAIDEALTRLLGQVITGDFAPSEVDEDVHSALERGLMEVLGERGGLLRAGRSRNDQVVTDLKLYLLDSFLGVSRSLVDLIRALLDKSEEMIDVIAPGFTHLQHAQPITFGQELSKHAFSLERDLLRIMDWRARTQISPLGSGALAGSSLVLEPERSAQALGFNSVAENSIDAVSDRDFVAEALFILALIGTHISRIGEEFTLFSSSEFGWVQVDDAYSTGSSIMPQKRNPDVAELARGKAGRLLGNLVAVMTVLKGLPFAYNRDLQEDKEPIFDSLDTLALVLPAITGMIKTARFDRVRISAGASSGFALATEVADYLVRKGVPFAIAHEITGRIVTRAEQKNCELHELDLADFTSVDERFDSTIFSVLDVGQAVASRTSRMGTSAASVTKAISDLRGRLGLVEKELEKDEERLGKLMRP